MKKSKLEKIILEQYASVTESKKFDELPKAFKDAIEKRYGKIHPKDFFSDDLTRYMKFDGENKETGELSHKVIPIPSFNKMYDDFQDIVDDIKVLMRDKDVRTDKAARELFELIKTNFRKLQRYLRIERPDQYAVIRGRVALQELVDLFKTHVSIIAEEKNLLKENLLDELEEQEEEPTPEEPGDDEGAVLTLAHKPLIGDTITVGYTKSGVSDRQVKDLCGNPMKNQSDISITNDTWDLADFSSASVEDATPNKITMVFDETVLINTSKLMGRLIKIF